MNCLVIGGTLFVGRLDPLGGGDFAMPIKAVESVTRQ